MIRTDALQMFNVQSIEREREEIHRLTYQVLLGVAETSNHIMQFIESIAALLHDLKDNCELDQIEVEEFIRPLARLIDWQNHSGCMMRVGKCSTCIGA